MKRKKSFREPLNRDDYWMGMAFAVAAGSKTFGRQQGAVIINPQGELVSAAHDGTPRSMVDSDHTVYAEINAIFAAKIPLTGCAIYLSHVPCYSSTQTILVSGLRRIVYYPNKTLDPEVLDLVRCAYGQLEEFKGNLNWMRDYLKSLEGLGIFD